MNPFSVEMRRNPYPWYAELRESSPVRQLPGLGVWMLFDYESVKRALSDHETFSSNGPGARGFAFEWLLFMDPPRHTKLRAIIAKAFTPRSIANLEPRIRQLSRELLDAVIARGEMDVATDFAVPLPMMVIAEMLGVARAEWLRLKRWSDAIMNLADTIIGTHAASAAASAAFLAANEEMKDYFGSLVAQRRRSPKDDLLTRLADAEVDGEHLDDDHLLRFVQLLLAAGTETTTNLIDNAIVCFEEHPDALERLRAAPEQLPLAIEEVLRYRSPAQAFFRVPRHDVELRGTVVPAGSFVIAVIGSANRDPAQFAAADRFDIARDPNAHIAFGHGIHFCLGAPLSRLEAKVALGDFIARVARFELASKEPWEPRNAFHVHGPTHLPIRFERARR